MKLDRRNARRSLVGSHGLFVDVFHPVREDCRA